MSNAWASRKGGSCWDSAASCESEQRAQPQTHPADGEEDASSSKSHSVWRACSAAVKTQHKYDSSVLKSLLVVQLQGIVPMSSGPQLLCVTPNLPVLHGDVQPLVILLYAPAAVPISIINTRGPINLLIMPAIHLSAAIMGRSAFVPLLSMQISRL